MTETESVMDTVTVIVLPLLAVTGIEKTAIEATVQIGIGTAIVRKVNAIKYVILPLPMRKACWTWMKWG